MNADGSCSVDAGGVFAYAADCSPTEIRAVVPWTAHTGDVVVFADGVASNPFPLVVTPLEVDKLQIVQGLIQVRVRADADIDSVVALGGDSPVAAWPLGGPDNPYMKDWYRVRAQPGAEVVKAMSYSRLAEVLYAAPIPLSETTDVPNDALYPSQWALLKIDASSAWTHSKGDGIKIAIVDTGFNASHPDLSAHMMAGWNCNGGRDVSPLNEHGTWVAGVAAATTNNNTGVAGVGWNSAILPLRFDSLDGLGTCPASQDLFLIDKAIAEGAKVINMSYTKGNPDPPLCDKLREAYERGLVPVAAAGNDNSSAPVDPAACSTVIAVGATNPDDTKASYSNFGSWVDVSAPGGTGTGTGPDLNCTGDATTLIYTTNHPSSPNLYALVCGTSFAAPHVAGVAALLASRHVDNCAIVRTITRTADPMSWAGGSGRLNGGRAVSNPQECPLYVPTGVDWVRFDSDAKADYCRRIGNTPFVDSKVRCTLSTGTGFGTEYTSFILDWGYDTGRAWVDHNGGGKADYCRRIGNTPFLDSKVRCTLSTGTGFGAEYTSFILDWGYDAGRGWVDFNGDGNADYCRRVGNTPFVDSKVRCTLSTGTGFGAEYTSPVLDWGYHAGRGWVDFNGDGNADYCRRAGNTPFVDSKVRCTLSTGTGFGAEYTSPILDWGYDSGVAWVDFNGDGRTDYCRRVGNTPFLDSKVRCILSTGTGFGAEYTSPVLDWGYQTGRAWADFSGDARADYCRRIGNTPFVDSKVRCTLSTGTGFGTEYTSFILDWGYDAGRAWADFTGPDPSRKVDYCRRVGNTPFLDSKLRCTLSAGTGFGTEYTSFILDWGYDD